MILQPDLINVFHAGIEDFIGSMVGKNTNEKGYDAFGDDGIAVGCK